MLAVGLLRRSLIKLQHNMGWNTFKFLLERKSLGRLIIFVRHLLVKLGINSYRASRDNWCTVGGDGGCRVGEVRAGTTSPMPDHKGFKLQ